MAVKKTVQNKKPKQKISKKKRKISGKGLLNSVINKLPVELHLPGYQYCGPGTKLDKRLKRNDPGVNGLDKACKEHDIAYAITDKTSQRNQADKILAKEAWKRVKAKDASIGERAAALGVAGIMKFKSKVGMGMGMKKKRGGSLKKSSSKKVKSTRKETPPKNISAARVKIGPSKPSKKLRTIQTPKVGGVLPLIPIFAGLSALGALMGGGAGVASAVISAKKAKNELKETQRHNETMEAIALGKKRNRKNGNGLYLRPNKKGSGLFLSPRSKNV